LKDWNTARIRCAGKYPQITTWINGLKICHWNGETCPLPEYDKERVFKILGREGSIGLQVHGGKIMWPTGTQLSLAQHSDPAHLIRASSRRLLRTKDSVF